MNTTFPCCSESLNKKYNESHMIIFNVDNEKIINDPNHNINLQITAMNTNINSNANIDEISITVYTYMENLKNEKKINFLQIRDVIETTTFNNESYFIYEKNKAISNNDFQIYCFAPGNHFGNISMYIEVTSEIDSNASDPHWIDEFKFTDADLTTEEDGGLYIAKNNYIFSIITTNELYPLNYLLILVKSSLQEMTLQCGISEEITNEVIELSPFRKLYSFDVITFEFPKYLKNLDKEYEVYVIIQYINNEILVNYKNEKIRLITNAELRYDLSEEKDLNEKLIIETINPSTFIVIHYEIRKKQSVKLIPNNDKSKTNIVYLNYFLPFKFIIDNNYNNSGDISINIKINSFRGDGYKYWYYPFNDFIIKTYALDGNATQHLLDHSSIDLPSEDNVCDITTFQYIQTIFLNTKYSNISYLYIELSDNQITNEIINDSFYMTISIAKHNSVYSPIEGKYFVDYLDEKIKFKEYYLYSNEILFRKFAFELAESIPNTITYEIIDIETQELYRNISSSKNAQKYQTFITLEKKIGTFNSYIGDNIIVLLRIYLNNSINNKVYYMFKYFSGNNMLQILPLSFEVNDSDSYYIAKHEKVKSSWGKITDYTEDDLVLLRNKPNYYYVHYNGDITNEGQDNSLCIVDKPIYESVTQNIFTELNNVKSGFEHSVKVYGYGIYSDLSMTSSQEYLVSTETVMMRESDNYKMLWKVFLFMYIVLAIVGFFWFGYRKLRIGNSGLVRNTLIEEDIEREKLSSINVG